MRDILLILNKLLYKLFSKDYEVAAAFFHFWSSSVFKLKWCVELFSKLIRRSDLVTPWQATTSHCFDSCFIDFMTLSDELLLESILWVKKQFFLFIFFSQIQYVITLLQYLTSSYLQYRKNSSLVEINYELVNLFHIWEIIAPWEYVRYVELTFFKAIEPQVPA